MIAARPPAQRWVRRYAPLTTLLVGLLIAITVLPSALNLPQANPQTLLEYAPVPNDSNQAPPPGSNLSALGLGTSGTAQNGGGGSQPTPAPTQPPAAGQAINGINRGTGTTSKYHCVGTPPRQSEDPLSPPCTAVFTGSNGGGTYTGVTADSITMLVYIDEEQVDNQQDPSNEYVDLDKPWPSDANVTHTRALAAFDRYFNARYQTYNRHVHMVIYYTGSSTTVTNYTPEYRQQDAAKTWNDLHPAIVISYAWEGNEESYLDAMASHGAIVFSSFSGRGKDFFNKYPGLIWGYQPSIEEQAASFASFVCTKIVPYRVSFSGNQLSPLSNGNPRKLGVLYADNPNRPEYKLFAQDVMKGLDGCGASYEMRSFQSVGFTYNTDPNDPYSASAQPTAAQNMAYFDQHNVTTIIWAQGYESYHMTAGSNIKYYPEWVLAGDGTLDGYAGMAYEDPSEMQHAWVVSTAVRQGTKTQGYCWQAAQEGNPNMPQSDAAITCQEYPFYDDLRMVFTGIQVAGPRFNPTNLDQGYHAIPAVQSTDPSVPSCFYEPGDYTCIKDAEAMWWDSTKLPPGSGQPGCWRMAQGGKRYVTGKWPQGDVTTMQDTTNDVCNGFGGNYYL